MSFEKRRFYVSVLIRFGFFIKMFMSALSLGHGLKHIDIANTDERSVALV